MSRCFGGAIIHFCEMDFLMDCLRKLVIGAKNVSSSTQAAKLKVDLDRGKAKVINRKGHFFVKVNKILASKFFCVALYRPLTVKWYKNDFLELG